MKKILLFLVLFMPLLATTAYSVEINGIYYSLNSEKKQAAVTWDYYTKYTGSVNIPETVTFNGVTYNVTSIGYNAFSGCTDLTSVTIPNSVTSIGYDAFSQCSGLTSVTIGNGVTVIEYRAFSYCSSLTSVVVGNSVASIGDYAFRDCSSLTSVTIPKSVAEIGDGTFQGCTNLTSVYISDLAAWCKINFTKDTSNPLYYAKHLFMNGTEIKSLVIPNSVTSIGNYAFYECPGLTSVTIPNSVTSIGESAFNGCTGLTSVAIPASVTSIGNKTFSGCSGLTGVTIGNGVTSIGQSAFRSCSGLKSVEIPNSVTSIGGEAFYGCSGLTSVTIGNGVTEIADYALYKCYGLKNIYCHAENVPTTGSHAFSSSTTSSATLYVPEASIESYRSTAPWSGFGNIVALNDGPVAEDVAINETNFPDENFRNWILSQDYGEDGVLTDAELASVTSIDVSQKEIQSLKGLEYFTALTFLDCCRNELTSLDVSNNTALTFLYCYDNLLTSLDVSNNTALTHLYCYMNPLTSLDVSNNTALTDLSCYNNLLTSLDVSNNTALTFLDCARNQIKDKEMDALVESLPKVDYGYMHVIYYDEGNVMTKTQVAAAKAKGWIPMYCSEDHGWQEYAGSEPVVLRGDVNGDGKISIQDAMFIVNYILNGKFPDEE